MSVLQILAVIFSSAAVVMSIMAIMLNFKTARIYAEMARRRQP